MIFFFGTAQAQNNPAAEPGNNEATIQTNATHVAHDTSLAHPSEKIIPQIKETIDRFPSYYLYIFIGCFVLLAVIRLLSPTYLRELLLSVFNLKLLLNIFKEGRFDWNVNNTLLDVVFVLMLSIGIHQGLFATDPGFFLWVFAFTAMGYFIKMILIQLLANIFFGRGEALVHLLMHTMFTRITGLILLPVLFAGLYQTVVPLPQLILVLAYILAACYVLWLVRVYVKMKSISTGGIFYLFLYLCAIEASPLIILLKEVIV
ncbi:MAG: DUF4271 domain-containing protein [Bacteroidia bacterium]